MRTKMKNIFTLLITTILLIGCNKNPSLWPENGVKLEATTYQLNVADTNIVLIEVSGINRITNFNDSLITSKDTISYEAPNPDIIKNIPFLVDQQVVHSKNAALVEFYSFLSGSVKLAGFAAQDTLKPLSIFDSPLVILPSINTSVDTTTSFMQTWNMDKKSFEKGQKTKTVVKLLKSGKLAVNDKEEQFYLYELTITRDAIVNFGEHGLIVPEAVLLRSNLLYGKSSGLIMEWGIRARAKEKEKETAKPEMETYLEVTKYTHFNK
jgi:hypothetical protein